MKKEIYFKTIIIFIFLILILSPFVLAINQNKQKINLQSMWNKITGNAVNNQEGYKGPTAEDNACLKQCVEIEKNQENFCMNKCGVEPEPTNVNKEENCMQKCIKKGCEKYDFQCESKNIESCEKDCGMITEPEIENKEQKCISDCVSKEDPTIICKSGKAEGEGEQGNEVCQKCATECVHLYDGPCLTDEKWRQKEEECMAQGEHMEAAPIRGDSGEGYECTIDLECIDRSGEWGDEPGKGPGIGQEGYEPPKAIEKAVQGIKNFFKNLFSSKEDESEEIKNNQEQNTNQQKETNQIENTESE